MLSARSQNLFVNLDGGFANYDGELQPRRYTFQQAHKGLGAGLGYELSPHITLSTELLYTKVSASDAYQHDSILKARNLNFTTGILEWNARVEYVLLDLSDYRLSPYIFAGLAIFHFNPYTYDTAGRKVFLKPLATEGEGLAGRAKPYSLWQPSIPVGLGAKFALSDNVRVGLEVGLRKTFTGYLDDVHTTYVDEANLLTYKGPEAVELAYRTNELPKDAGVPYPHQGALRGDGEDDWYYFTAVRISIRINGGTYITRHMRCPKKPT